MRVALVTEGTYPHGHGGVSVWCDQLVRGLDEHEYDLIAITGTGNEPLAWELPPNVYGVQNIPLWGAPVRPLPRRPITVPVEWRPVSGRGRGSAVVDSGDGAVRDVALRLGHALVDSDLPSARPAFRAALGAWARAAPTADVEGAVLSPEFIELLMDRWTSDTLSPRWGGRDRGVPTVGDAVTATRLMAHALRPLMAPLPEVDLVHLVANGIAGLTGMATKWRHGTPYVLSEHGVYLRERYLSFGASAYSWPVKWLMLRFYRLLTSAVYAEAAIVAPGNVYNRRWELWDGVPDASIRTVYNGVDPIAFDVEADEPTVPTLTWVGRIDPIKDVATLLRAFALVRTELPQARLRIFGQAPRGGEVYRDQMRVLARALGLMEDAVTFEGRVEVIQDAYAAGNVVVLTSISEGFPYTVIEAMSCSRATVSTDVGGVAEAVGDAGLVVPPGNPRAVAQACLTLLRDDARRARLAAKARSRVVELFTLDRSLGAFRAIYSDVAAAHGLAADVVVPA